MNISTVNELIQSLESAGELSIKERKYLDIMRWAVGVAGERDAALNAERVWETAMMEVCGEDGPASVASEIRALQVLRDTRIQALNSQVEQLAAENIGLKGALTGSAYISFIKANGWNTSASTVNGKFVNFADPEVDFGSMVFAHAKKLIEAVETPATDAFLAGIKADGVEEFAAYQRAITEEWACKEGHSSLLKVAESAELFAKQLRDGGKND